MAIVYEVVQLPDTNIQDDGPNAPPALLSLQDTVPVGIVGELEVSLTVTVSVTDDPGFAVCEFEDMVTDVESEVLGADVLLLSVNIILLLSAIAGRMAKPPKSDNPKMKNMVKNGIVELCIFNLPLASHSSDVTYLFFLYICSLKELLR